jgi:hypothetical protein
VVSRLLSGDLVLSYVPDAEQRSWRMLTRTKYQLTRDRVRLQCQLESWLEECQIKLSSLVSDLLGASGRRILRALADGETDPARLAALGNKRLRASPAELRDPLSGQVSPRHRQVLALYLARLELIEAQVAQLAQLIAEAMTVHPRRSPALPNCPAWGRSLPSRSLRKSARRLLPSRPPPNSPHGSVSVPAGTRAPESRAATAPRRGTAPCAGFSTSSRTPPSAKRARTCNSSFGGSLPAWGTTRPFGLSPTACAV